MILMVDAAIVGLGWWGKSLVEAVQGKSECLRFVRGVSKELAAGREFGAAHGFEVSAELEDILADPRVHAVVLATPHSLHTAQIVAAARAGKHVFCEKPLALSLADALRSVAACKAAGVVLGLGTNKRFWPSMRELRRIVMAGALGEILHVEGHSCNENSGGLFSSWRNSPQESPGGGMTGSGLHVLDALVSLMGPVAKVHARLQVRRAQPAPLDSVSALVEFANGVSGTLGTVRASPLYWRVHVFGSQGSAEALGENELVLRRSGKEMERRQFEPLDSVRAVLEAFAGAVEGRAAFPIPAGEMLAVIAAFEATVRSIEADTLLTVSAS
jgi:predicted dehydrogenase